MRFSPNQIFSEYSKDYLQDRGISTVDIYKAQGQGSRGFMHLRDLK